MEEILNRFRFGKTIRTGHSISYNPHETDNQIHQANTLKLHQFYSNLQSSN